MDADAYFWIASVLKTNGGIGLDPGSHAMIAEKIAEQRERIRELEQQLTAARERERDSARLDALDAMGYAYGFEDMHEGNRWQIEGPFPNVRAAIDAALSHEQAQQEAGRESR